VNEITINGWCKQCGICEAFCPKKVFDFKPGYIPVATRPEDCIGCGLCGLRCPDFAIEVKVEVIDG
jgi:2-oxoglutarate ferredoxin oxidoreductase subunit delta